MRNASLVEATVESRRHHTFAHNGCFVPEATRPGVSECCVHCQLFVEGVLSYYQLGGVVCRCLFAPPLCAARAMTMFVRVRGVRHEICAWRVLLAYTGSDNCLT